MTPQKINDLLLTRADLIKATMRIETLLIEQNAIQRRQVFTKKQLEEMEQYTLDRWRQGYIEGAVSGRTTPLEPLD